ncbi:MAG: transposase [Cypionkella sp.]|uniref:IS66-like element accessory protein TnpA n=1 Tax=Paracoccaceae TaxID=31989 RepID=UPI00273221E8|nr:MULTISPECIES: transposase [Paracoccaceae]MDP2079734.1 transposase [Pseudotabrizicola sp.]MDZ4312540.1 transposase [Cypionkella sp.]
MEHQNEHRMEVRGSNGVSRIEVLDGPTGRRRWPDDLKARIVAESFQPGARVCDVAAKYGLIARHLSGWRAQARKGELAVPVDMSPAFVPLVIEPLADVVAAAASVDTGVIKVDICGAVLHVAPDCSPERAAALVAALRNVL